MYRYVGNNPANMVDPYGLVRWRQLWSGVRQTVVGGVSVVGGAAVAYFSGGTLSVPAGIIMIGGGYSFGSGLRNIWNGILETPGPVPGGLLEALGTSLTMETGRDEYRLAGQIGDLLTSLIAGRLDPSDPTLLDYIDGLLTDVDAIGELVNSLPKRQAQEEQRKEPKK